MQMGVRQLLDHVLMLFNNARVIAGHDGLLMLRAALATGLANNDPEAIEIDVSIYLTSHGKDLSNSQYFVSYILDMGSHRTVGVLPFPSCTVPSLETVGSPLVQWLISRSAFVSPRTRAMNPAYIELSSRAVTHAHGRLSHRITARPGDTRAGVQETSADPGTPFFFGYSLLE